MPDNINNIKNNNIFRICLGSIIAIVFTLLSLLIFSLILSSTSISENTITPVIIILSSISILAGSTISSRKIKQKGFINGLLVGLIYIAFIYLLSSIASGNFSLNLTSFIMIIASLAAGIIGGIIGVNL